MKTLAYAAIFVASLLGLFSSKPLNGYGVGDVAEDFYLKNVDGKMYSLDSVKGATMGYIVVFTCNHCPYAQLYEQRIIELNKRFKDRGFPVVAINPNSPEIVPEDSYEEMQRRAKSRRYSFPYLFDEQQTVYPRYGATRTPHVFILDTNKVVRYIGAIDDNAESPNSVRTRYVENALEALLNGASPEPDFTRAVGCTIKKKP